MKQSYVSLGAGAGADLGAGVLATFVVLLHAACAAQAVDARFT